jgi:hypothetical protein
MAAAGLWTTPTDLARLGVHFMRTLKAEKSFIGLSEKGAAAMLSPQIPTEISKPSFAGLGWTCHRREQIIRCGHTGWNEGFVAEMTLLPAIGKGAVVMINSNQGAPLRKEIIESIAREYKWPDLEPAFEPMLVSAEVDYTGTYQNCSGVLCRVAQRAGTLVLKFTDQSSLALRPTSTSEFLSENLDLKVAFDFNSSREVTSCSVVQNGLRMRFDRIAKS